MKGIIKRLTVLMLALSLVFIQPVQVEAKGISSYKQYVKGKGVYYKKMPKQYKAGYKAGKKQFQKNNWQQMEYAHETLIGKQWYLADNVAAYKMDGAMSTQQVKQTFNTAKRLARVAKGKKSKYKKAKALHDALIKHVTYGSGSYSGQTAYEALVGKQSVCAGYSRAYKLLCDIVGIPCYCVFGDAQGGLGAGGPHAWNIIKLDDGQWYEVDVTFDEGLTQGGQICREFFCLTTAEMTSKTTKQGMNATHTRNGLGNEAVESLMKVVPIAKGKKYAGKKK